MVIESAANDQFTDKNYIQSYVCAFNEPVGNFRGSWSLNASTTNLDGDMFSKPLNQLTCDDVREFCKKGVSEGKHLDYKGAIPKDGSKIAKTIAAFANTEGGTLIFGVIDENDKPKTWDGITFHDKLINQIEQINRDNVQPVPYIESYVCAQENGKTFLIVRVPQSTLTPHHLLNEDAVYVRTGESNRREALIHPDKLPWLFEGRARSTAYREQLIDAAGQRFKVQFPDQVKRVFSGGMIMPLYPTGSLFPLANSQELVEKIQTISGYARLPHRSIPGGMVFGKKYDSGYMNDDVQFAQVLDVGMFCFRHALKVGTQWNPNLISAHEFLRYFCELLLTARKLQAELDLWAPMLIRYEAENLYRRPIKPISEYEDYHDAVSMLDNTVTLDITLPGAALNEYFLEVFMTGIWRMMWMLGLHRVNKIVVARELVRAGFIPDEFRADDIEDRLVEAFEADVPLVDFSFSSSIDLSVLSLPEIKEPTRLSPNAVQ